MKQTIKDPKTNVEKNRYDQTREKWFSLSDEDKVMFRLQFIADLKYEYHKPFFEKLDIHQIINERWFRHYFESIFFEDDQFKIT